MEGKNTSVLELMHFETAAATHELVAFLWSTVLAQSLGNC